MQNKLLDKAEKLLEQVNHYRTIAGSIDHKIICNSEHYVPLDNLPYGEEMIRTNDFPQQLSKAIETLENDEITLEELSSINEQIEFIEDTLDDCTSLPSNREG